MAKLKKTLPKEFTELCSKTIWTSDDIELGKKLLSTCEPDATERGGYKETVLHQIFIPIEIVEWQIERGADVNAPNTYGTPLFAHAGRGNYEICRYLIEHGANLNAEDYAGNTPLFKAADKAVFVEDWKHMFIRSFQSLCPGNLEQIKGVKHAE